MSPVASAPARLTGPEARLRTAYLAEVLEILYPGGAGDTEYLVLPHPGKPRLLVPARARRGAAAAVRHATEPGSWRARAVRQVAAAGLRAGAGRLLPGRVRVAESGSIAPHLQQAIGQPVSLAIHIGPARANRKPVLQLLDPAGHTTGFAKLGVGPLTLRLVRAETAALTALAQLRLRQVTVPRVRHAGPWREHQLLVQSAVPVWRPRAPLCPQRLALAMREVAYCCGVSRGPLGSSPYWKRLQERLGAVSDQPEGATLAAAATALAARAGDRELAYGAWHGDWAPWNMAVLADTLLVWDWERFTVGVPLGLDAVHYDLQRRLGGGSDATDAVTGMLAAAGTLLAPFRVPEPDRKATALLYLIDLATRYLTDRQAQAGARLGVLGSWLLPVLRDRLQEVR